MLTPETLCNVTNRSYSIVSYTIPDKHIRREFNIGETKRIPYQELLDLVARSGGRELLYNYLYMDNSEAIEEGLNVRPEPEYYLTEDKIDEWLQTCSLDEFKDALDFAPSGVVALIKAHAVSLPLNDMAKCKALKDIIGFNAEAAIRNERDTTEDGALKSPTKQRRASASAATEATRRATSKYKVVGRDDKEV